MAQQRLELTWVNKDKALIPTEHGRYGYTWVDPRDPRYCEIRPLVLDGEVHGSQAPKNPAGVYTARADLEPQTDNLLIHGESGDVLEALTRVPELAEKYVGEVKCIYIDPPFNTSQTFTHYEDNLEHSVWLTMMRDRLLHLRKLLSPDGSIWVHLDDVEVHRMRLLMDEVFGAGNFVAEVVWQKADSPRSDGSGISVDQDIILVYQRSNRFEVNRLPRLSTRDALYTSPDGDEERWISGDPAAPGADRGSRQHPGVYGIQNPVTGEMIYPARGRVWSNAQDTVLELLSETARYRTAKPNLELRTVMTGIATTRLREDVLDLKLDRPLMEDSDIYADKVLPRLYFTRGGRGGLKMKKYLSEIASDRAVQTWWTKEDVGHNRGAKKEIGALFPAENSFDTPKPERLLERVIHIATNPGDIVLDVFAGSGTTAAVAQKMGRRWVTCELLEDTIDRFTRPRLEKVLRGDDPGGVTSVPGQREEVAGVGLPEGMTAEEAQRFTSLLNKVIKEDSDGLKTDPVVKQLKALTKTVKTKDALNWRGGGGFTTAHLAPPVFDYDPELGMILLTEHATGGTLIRSVAANLGFRLTPEHPHFDGVRGSMRLTVVEGTVTTDAALDLASHLGEDEGLTIAALGREDGVASALRRQASGVRVLHVPDDLFRHLAPDPIAGDINTEEAS